jgi:hypothetical protein
VVLIHYCLDLGLRLSLGKLVDDGCIGSRVEGGRLVANDCSSSIAKSTDSCCGVPGVGEVGLIFVGMWISVRVV